MAEKMHLRFFIFAMIGCITVVSVNSATTHKVGGEMGWSLPNYSTFYMDWSKNQTFAVGDELLFQYRAGLNTVLQVSKDDYDHCTTKKTIDTYFRGNSSFVLDKPGDYYFLNSVGKHCEKGQRMWVIVPQGNPAAH